MSEMPVPARGGWLVCAALLGCAPDAAAQTPRRRGALPVEGGANAVALAAGIEPGLPAWRVLYEACRRRHGLWGEDAGGTAAEPLAPPADGFVPLPLEPSFWRTILRDESPVPENRLAFAILDDRRAALVYRALAALDEETLAAVGSDESAWRRLSLRHAEVLAAFGSRFAVRGGVVAVPGGPDAEPIWESLAGASPRAPLLFLPRLLERSGGRLAFLYDSLARLDAPRQRAALGLVAGRGSDPLAPARLLAAAMGDEPAWWRATGGAFARPDVDAARVLREVRLGEDGSVAPPAAEAFWLAVFEGRGTTLEEVRASPRVDLAWLASAVGRGAPSRRSLRLAQLAFAQRVFGAAAEAAPREAIRALSGLADSRALVLSLERMGARDPGLFAEAVSGARAVITGARGSTARIAGVQGALGVVDRARASGGIDAATAEGLVRSLLAPSPLGSVALGPPGLASWIDDTLLPALRRASPGARDAEATLVDAMAGLAAEPRAVPAFEWEGQWYRAQPERAEARRLERVRRRQAGRRLDDALAVCRAPGGASGPACAGALGEALTSLVYAAHLGDPDGPALRGGDPARRHDFLPDPWALPREVVGPGVPWHAQGSLLGLELALARLSLHPLDPDRIPERAPALDAVERRQLAVDAVLASPLAASDAARDSLARAVADGRRRAQALAPSSPDLPAVARDAGLDPWRARGLEWLLEHEPLALHGFFSLAELAYLGAPDGGPWDAWGAPDPLLLGLELRLARPRPLDESAGRRPDLAGAESFADLGVKVALHLSERGLPASLTPGLVSRLLPDLFDEARPIAADDRLALEAWVRGVTRERLDEAVASLVGAGALQPAAAPGRAQ